MVDTKVRSNPVLVVGYGQSMWHHPIGGTTVLDLIRAAGYATLDLAEDGIAWTQFAKRYQGTLLPHANDAPTVIGAFMGATTDIALSVSGATAYGHVQTIAAAFKAAGANKVINMTLTGSAQFDTGAKLTEWAAYNAACAANSGGTFDAVVDLNGAPELDDHTDQTYYQADLTHWRQAGTNAAGALILAGIASVI